MSEEKLRIMVNDLRDSLPRAKILEYLYSQKDVGVTNIALRINLSRSNVHYHCGVLTDLNLIETWLQPNKRRYTCITDWGRRVHERFRKYKEEKKNILEEV